MVNPRETSAYTKGAHGMADVRILTADPFDTAAPISPIPAGPALAMDVLREKMWLTLSGNYRPSLPRVQLLLWRVLGGVTLGTVGWFTVVCAVTGAAYGAPLVVTAFLAMLCMMLVLLVIPTALTLLALHGAHRWLAAYCSISGFVASGGATFIVGCYTVANASGISMLFVPIWYALGLAFAALFASATFTQVAIYLTIRPTSRRSAALRMTAPSPSLAP